MNINRPIGIDSKNIDYRLRSAFVQQYQDASRDQLVDVLIGKQGAYDEESAAVYDILEKRDAEQHAPEAIHNLATSLLKFAKAGKRISLEQAVEEIYPELDKLKKHSGHLLPFALKEAINDAFLAWQDSDMDYMFGSVFGIDCFPHSHWGEEEKQENIEFLEKLSTIPFEELQEGALQQLRSVTDETDPTKIYEAVMLIGKGRLEQLTDDEIKMIYITLWPDKPPVKRSDMESSLGRPGYYYGDPISI